MKKKILYCILCIFFLGSLEHAFAAGACPDGEQMILGNCVTPTNSATRGVNAAMLQVWGGDNSANADKNVNLKDNFLKIIQTYMMGLAGIISVAVFLYIGYTLFTAQGNEEEFKKAWKALVYAAIGLAVMPLAYIAVKIVTGFTL